MATLRTTLLLAILALPSPAATLFVSKSGDGSNGNSWETAFQEIGTAILNSTTDDEIWVASGTYFENLAVVVPLTILGGFLGNETLNERELRDPSSNPTVIDGLSKSSVLLIHANVHIDGLTIQHGKATNGSGLHGEHCDILLTRVSFTANGEGNSNGGGIYSSNANLTLDQCFVSSNSTEGNGGGVYCDQSNLRLLESEFHDNVAFFLGSGVFISNGSAEVFRCDFKRNGLRWESDSGGGLNAYKTDLKVIETDFRENIPSGLSLAQSKAEITGVSFVQNDGHRGGGGIRINSSEFLIDRCILHRNETSVMLPQPGPFTLEGGGILSHESTGEITNSIFRNNFATLGSAIRIRNSEQYAVALVNCTFDVTHNTVALPFSWNKGAPLLTNCVVIGHDDLFEDNNARVTYSLIQRGYPGEGNIDADPKFVDPDHGDYHLQRGSPCSEAGTDTGLTEDYDGKGRPLGDYDMGAFEYPFLRGDVDLDGRVDDNDLIILSRDWKKVSGS